MPWASSLAASDSSCMMGLLQQRLEAAAWDGDGLVAFGTGRDHADIELGCAAQELEVVAGAGRQVGFARDAFGRALPAGHGFVNRLEPVPSGGGGRNGVGRLAGISRTIQAVAYADRDVLERIEHIELGDDERLEAVEQRGVAEQRGVEPADAAGPPGDAAELVAALAQLVRLRALDLGGKGAAADPSAIGLAHAHGGGDAGGGKAGADAGPAGGGAGGGDERIGSVVNVQQRALRAFEQYGFA